MTSIQYADGISFFNSEGNEIAFYSYITKRIDFYPGGYSNWNEIGGVVSLPIEDINFIYKEIKT